MPRGGSLMTRNGRPGTNVCRPSSMLLTSKPLPTGKSLTTFSSMPYHCKSRFVSSIQQRSGKKQKEARRPYIDQDCLEKIQAVHKSSRYLEEQIGQEK